MLLMTLDCIPHLPNKAMNKAAQPLPASSKTPAPVAHVGLK